tara:strand:+ start:199 stop:615 length:417 start_codon:yes stop_codon:yes gene_type:complete
MCSGGDDSARRDAERRQREADERAAQRQAELDALAAQRSALAASQVQQLADYETQASNLELQNIARAEELTAEKEVKVAGIKRAGNAASNSLRILGQQQPTAPTARQTMRRPKASGGRMTAARYQRGTGSTRGTNLSI